MGSRFVMKRVGLLVSLKCNLKCRLCTAFSPYLSSCKQPSLDDLLLYVDKLFKIVDYVELFTITGGEPLLFKQLPDVVNALSEYKDRIGRVEIITNGNFVPSNDLLTSVRKLGGTFSRFLVDDYGERLSTKIKEIDDVLKESKLPYEIRSNTAVDPYCNGWVDYGFGDLVNTPEEAKELFDKCAQPNKFGFCFALVRGKLLPCPVIIYRMYSESQNVDQGDYIDLLDDTLDVEEQRQKISNIYNAKCLESCQYCNGMYDGCPRFIPAEQITPEEIKQTGRVIING